MNFYRNFFSLVTITMAIGQLFRSKMKFFAYISVKHLGAKKWSIHHFACLCRLLTKPFHNWALRVFQRYYEELCSGRHSNDVVQKSRNLMQAVERSIVSDTCSTPLRKFCCVLRERHGVGSVVSRMKFWLG